MANECLARVKLLQNRLFNASGDNIVKQRREKESCGTANLEQA